MKKILLSMIALSVMLSAELSRSGDIVTDSTTQLQWQDDAAAKTVTRDWQGAIDYCEALGLGGHDDWRLPNIRELRSIVDRDYVKPAINPQFENIVYAGYGIDYWSSTTSESRRGDAWNVEFNGGYWHRSGKNAGGVYVRCVRSGQ